MNCYGLLGAHIWTFIQIIIYNVQVQACFMSGQSMSQDFWLPLEYSWEGWKYAYIFDLKGIYNCTNGDGDDEGKTWRKWVKKMSSYDDGDGGRIEPYVPVGVESHGRSTHPVVQQECSS